MWKSDIKIAILLFTVIKWIKWLTQNKIITKNFRQNAGIMMMCNMVPWAMQHKIWNSRDSENEDCSLLGCDTVGQKGTNILEKPFSGCSQNTVTLLNRNYCTNKLFSHKNPHMYIRQLNTLTEAFHHLPQSLQKNQGTAIYKTACFTDKTILHSRSPYLAYNPSETHILFTHLFQHILLLSNKLTPLSFNIANIRACQQRWSWASTIHLTLPQLHFQNTNLNVTLSPPSVFQGDKSSFITNKTEVCEKPGYCTVICEKVNILWCSH
jgi:hypothetical protein